MVTNEQSHATVVLSAHWPVRGTQQPGLQGAVLLFLELCRDSGAFRELFIDYEEPLLLLKIQRAYKAIHSNSKSIHPSERNPI